MAKRSRANVNNRRKGALERLKKQLEAKSIPTSKRNDLDYVKEQIKILESKIRQ